MQLRQEGTCARSEQFPNEPRPKVSLEMVEDEPRLLERRELSEEEKHECSHLRASCSGDKPAEEEAQATLMQH